MEPLSNDHRLKKTAMGVYGKPELGGSDLKTGEGMAGICATLHSSPAAQTHHKWGRFTMSVCDPNDARIRARHEAVTASSSNSSSSSGIEILSVVWMLSAANCLRALCIASYPDEGLLKSSVRYAPIPVPTESGKVEISYSGISQ